MYLNSFTRWQLSVDISPIPDEYKLYIGNYLYPYHSSMIDKDKIAYAKSECYVVAKNEDMAKAIIIDELKKTNSNWFCNILDNEKEHIIKTIQFSDAKELDEAYIDYPPINDVNYNLSIKEFFEAYNLMIEKNKQFEASDKKQLKFNFYL